MALFYLFIYVVLCCVVGAWTKSRGRSQELGFILGFLLTPVLGGIIVLSMGRKAQKTVPIRRTIYAPSYPSYGHAGSESFRINHSGSELGPYSSIQIRQLIKAGKLSSDDHYFDPVSEDWAPLLSLLNT